MNSKITKIFLILMIMTQIIGCGNVNLGDTYIEGSDYQYMYQGTGIFYPKMAGGSKGLFFLMGHYIYYLDNETQKLVPLCNKADCLHDKETDEERYQECNAHVSDASGNIAAGGLAGISYCNGYLYFLESDLFVQNLYRLKEDGSGKELVYQWSGFTVEAWCIHRDIFYFVEHNYEVQEDQNGVSQKSEKYSVKQLELTGKHDIETIYEAEKGLTVYTLSVLRAFGNHVYFTIQASTLSDTSSITDDNYLDSLYFKQITYDIRTKECKDLVLPEEKKGVYINDISFWNEKLILETFDFNQELNGTANTYLSDLDGSNVEIFEENVIQGEKYISDGNYLYITNSPLVIRGFEDKQYYRVYDKDMNLVDTLAMPYSNPGDPEIGKADRQYIFMQNENNTGAELNFFDKSTIGTYDGAEYTLQKVTDYYYSAEDLATLQEMEEQDRLEEQE